MIIKNSDVLNKSSLRSDAISILETGLKSVATRKAIENSVELDKDDVLINKKRYHLNSKSRLLIIGVGKCSLDSGKALEQILGDKIYGGGILDIRKEDLKKLKVFKGSHPFPSVDNALATKELISFLPGLTKDDLVIFIISGGGSTLLCQPQGMTCGDEADILENLFKKGASISEINTLRKHISLARGGHLSKYAYPARVVSLIFSDVPGDDITMVASGPTIKDPTTISDAREIVEKYNLDSDLPNLVDLIMETPKEDKYFENVDNILLASNSIALRAMQKAAEGLGYEAHIVNTKLTGEARQIGKEIAKNIATYKKPTVLLYGGETTVTISGQGTGGRNQELVLSALSNIDPKSLIAAISSDGRDNTDHAGALCDIITTNMAHRRHIDLTEYLVDNNSYKFFERVGDFIETGDTGVNISDLVLALHE